MIVADSKARSVYQGKNILFVPSLKVYEYPPSSIYLVNTKVDINNAVYSILVQLILVNIQIVIHLIWIF